jgi:hypothetical protein
MAMSARPLLAALLLPALLLSAASAADSKSTAPAFTPSIPHAVALRAAATLLVFMLACGDSGTGLGVRIWVFRMRGSWDGISGRDWWRETMC